MADQDAGDWGLLDPLESNRSRRLTGDDAVLAAMVEVETALAAAWVDTGSAPQTIASLAFAITGIDRSALATGNRAGGNPVIPLVAQLREQAEAIADGSGDWVHRGATSQDIVDSALMLVASRSVAETRRALAEAADALARLADAHRATLMVGRTLSQHAAPITFGVKASGWLDGVLASIAALDALEFPVQLAGAVGTGSAFADLAGDSDAGPRLRAALADRLRLSDPGRSWQTERSPVVAVGAAAALVVGALGRIATDVLVLARTEVGEVFEGSAGGSSAMPQKRNPTTSVLLRAAALEAPGRVATLFGSLVAEDERPSGAWHAEWPALRRLLRLALESADAAATLVGSLAVNADRMTVNLDADGDLTWAEHAQSILTPQLGTATAAAVVRRAIASVSPKRAFATALAAELASIEVEGTTIDLSPASVVASSTAIVDATLARHAAVRGAPVRDAAVRDAPGIQEGTP